MKYASRKGIPHVWFPANAEQIAHEVRDVATGEQAPADVGSWEPGIVRASWDNWMFRSFFDEAPTKWQGLEDMVQQAFAEMGYESRRNYKLQTVRGEVAIDVYAIKRSSPIPTVVLCECKYWNKSVPQNVVHSFRTVCSDAGAHFGLIISKRGFQPGAENSRGGTNIHLMNFAEFQDTFFDEWMTGAFMAMSMMHGQLLPIFRASAGMTENGLNLIDNKAIENVDVFNKYSIFFGYDGRYSEYFIEGGSFPATINDPRGDPRKIVQVTVRSHREYFEIAREAVIEATKIFNLPIKYISEKGQILNSANGDGQIIG